MKQFSLVLSILLASQAWGATLSIEENDKTCKDCTYDNPCFIIQEAGDAMER